MLQTLSVIGREFTLSLIHAALRKTGEELARMLDDLQLGEFIYEQPAVGDTEYIFKHALTQEVAYNSVLIERRKQTHERIGLAIESLYGDSIDDHLSELAHHFSRSGDTDRAVRFLTLACRQSLDRYAYAEAGARLREGLLQIRKLPESSERDVRELEILGALSDVAWVSTGVDAPETRKVTERAAALAERTGNILELVRQLNLLRVTMQRAGDFVSAFSLANQILELAEREGSPASFADAYQGTLQARFYSGDLAGMEEQFALWRNYQEATRAEGNSRVVGLVIVLATAALAAWSMGRIRLARDRMAEAVAMAATSKDPFALMVGKSMESILFRNLREPEAALAAAKQSTSIAEENSLRFNMDVSSLTTWAIANLGDPAEAMDLVRREIADSTNTRSMISLTSGLFVYSELQAMAGMHDEAMDSIQTALSPENQDQSFRPELIRIRGELWSRRGDHRAAEADFRAALKRSKQMRAKMLELRAATSLARLLHDTDRREEARAILAGIYDWFTEGFDTADLKDAKALLDDLGVSAH